MHFQYAFGDYPDCSAVYFVSLSGQPIRWNGSRSYWIDIIANMHNCLLYSSAKIARKEDEEELRKIEEEERRERLRKEAKKRKMR